MKIHTKYDIGIIAITGMIKDIFINGMGTVDLYNSNIVLIIHPKDEHILMSSHHRQMYTVKEYFATKFPTVNFTIGDNTERILVIYQREIKEAKESLLSEINAKRMYFGDFCTKAVKELSELV